MADEDVPDLSRRTTVAEVLDEGLGYLGKKGEAKLLACFGLAENDASITPVDVIKADPADIGWSHSVSRRK